MNISRYLQAEQALFSHAGISPKTLWLDLPRLGVRTRVLDVGEGQPVIFFHGGPNAAATFSYLVSEVRGLRCLLVDRPGCGLSEAPTEIPGLKNLPFYVSNLLEDIFDGLEIDCARLVGSSFGGYAVLRGALDLGKRVQDITLLGCPAFVPGWTGPSFANLLRVPLLGRALMAMPASAAAVRMSLRQFGHGQSLEKGRIPAPMLDWMLSWQRDTETLRNDGSMIRKCGSWPGGFHPELDLTDEQLGRLRIPVHLAFGGEDPVGGAATGERLAGLLQNATLSVLPQGGHLPWLDDHMWAASQLGG